ncbi:glycosyltransferase [Candidatus Poriferisodalis sp.]|uniref:glycosyltransferase n=1 Tax=Candidatus Poriferisodalis sp. TaxID=3101277 RepID=UPI003D0FFF77
MGPRSDAVFAVGSHDVVGPHREISIVLADTPEHSAALPPGIAAVTLTSVAPLLAVPALDVTAVNPIGWKRAHDPPLKPSGQPAAATARSTSDMRRAHHVPDWTHSDADPAVRAGELVSAAAVGAVVCVKGESTELESCLGTELYGLMSDAGRIKSADTDEREALSISMRRAALRDHSREARARQVLAAAGLGKTHLPLVSVLVPTRRPDRMSAVINSVAAQTYPHVEVVLGLHGSEFERTSTEAQLGRLQCPAQAIDVAADRSLGEVLNTALAVAAGEMIAKFDDDDLYGPLHLWDLVLAAGYSEAAMVGKVSEYVYLAGANRTIRRFVDLGERFINPDRSSVAGGAVLVKREALDTIGGWRAMSVGEDKALTRDIAASGGSVYRTHGSGYLLVRHGVEHTWEADDSYFLEQAHESRDGCDLCFAGVN